MAWVETSFTLSQSISPSWPCKMSQLIQPHHEWIFFDNELGANQ